MNGRPSNRQALADLNIGVAIQKEIINDLTVDNYCGGPDPDEKYVWKQVGVFGAVYNRKELYIKFSIGAATEKVVCISFHIAERPMKYQFK